MVTIALIILACHFLHRRGISNRLTRFVMQRALLLRKAATGRNVFSRKGTRLAPCFALLFLSCLPLAAGASPWELKRDSDGIRIYTRSTDGSAIKDLKASFDVRGSLNRVSGVLLDVAGQKEWVYATEQSIVVRRISASEITYYTVKEMPWPVSNRDVVMRMKLTSDTEKGLLTLSAASEANVVPEKKGVVRIHNTEVLWTVTAVGNGMLHVEYLAKVDPGGSLPVWVANMFLTRGPYETFMQFRKKIEAQPS